MLRKPRVLRELHPWTACQRKDRRSVKSQVSRVAVAWSKCAVFTMGCIGENPSSLPFGIMLAGDSLIFIAIGQHLSARQPSHLEGDQLFGGA